MLSRFLKSTPIEEEILDWQFQTLDWLANSVADIPFLREGQLVLPTEEFFPVKAAGGFARAEEIFDMVKNHMGLTKWPCRLEEGASNRPSMVGGELLKHVGEQAPGGTFNVEGEEEGSEEVVIRFNPEKLSDPVSLIATFAHELSHYFTAYAKAEPPGGWDLWEPATDFTAVQMGFGIFLTNSAFNYSQSKTSWSSQHQGYLSEHSLLFATALFAKITGTETALITAHLKPALIKQFRKSVKYLDRNPERLERFLN